MGEQRTAQRWADVPTSTVSAAGADIAYRELGPRTGVPLVALTHLGANLDDWDPRIMDGLAEERHVVAIGYRGVGGSTGQVQGTIESMAADVVAALEALGHERVDLFGQSMGGMVAQAVAVPDASHGAVAQHGRQVVATMLDHLRRPTTTPDHQEKTS